MLQQDYIMRLIQEFAAALRKFLQKPEGEDKDTMLRDLYRQYVGDYEFYHTAATEDALASMEQYDERERTHRIEMQSLLNIRQAYRRKPHNFICTAIQRGSSIKKEPIHHVL